MSGNGQSASLYLSFISCCPILHSGRSSDFTSWRLNRLIIDVKQENERLSQSYTWRQYGSSTSLDFVSVTISFPQPPFAHRKLFMARERQKQSPCKPRAPEDGKPESFRGRQHTKEKRLNKAPAEPQMPCIYHSFTRGIDCRRV